MFNLGSIVSFLNDLFLNMTWLKDAVEFFLHTLLGIPIDHVLFPGISFFIYDVIKIFILLSVVIYLSSFVLASITPEKTKSILTKFNGLKGNIFGALLGTITPFCSCSSIPLFIGFTKAGLPLGVTFSFLISSPLVDIASIILLISIFGIEVAALYVLFGLIIAISGGSLISKLYTKDDVESFVYEGSLIEDTQAEVMTPIKRHRFAILQVKDIYKKVWLYILIGVGIGAIIHGYIPESLIQSILNTHTIFDVIIAVMAGIPMYADIFGTLPIAEALVSKGVGIGTVLAFMMSVTALSIPSILLLKQVIKKRLLIGFISIVVIGITLTGYLFNLIF